MNIRHDLVSIQCIFTAHDHGHERPINAHVRWFRPDPLAVHVSFLDLDGTPKRWVWSRDLLTEGITRPAGNARGDIRLAPGPDGSRVHIELSPPDGYLALSVSLVTLGEFLKATYRKVPAGTEYAGVDLDAELAAWLGEAAA